MRNRANLYRAVENGLALVRPARRGIKWAVDRQGRLLVYKPDYFVSDDHATLGNVPVKGTPTLYAGLGDLFIYLCIAGLVVVAALGLWNGRRKDACSRWGGSGDNAAGHSCRPASGCLKPFWQAQRPALATGNLVR